MKKKGLLYIGFFVLLTAVFLFFVFKDYDFSKSTLGVISTVPDFTFVNQDGKNLTQNDIEDKVFVAEYFFTTCRGICPKMNANMRRVYNQYKDEKNFMILSHTCMPETDSVHVLKKYEQKMLGGKLSRSDDGSYNLKAPTDSTIIYQNTNWQFLTGDKTALYKIARNGYMIDNGNVDSLQKISDQFIHTQFFALVDKYRRVRGIYDGLKEEEVQKMLGDIKGLLDERVKGKRFMNGFSNNPE